MTDRDAAAPTPPGQRGDAPGPDPASDERSRREFTLGPRPSDPGSADHREADVLPASQRAADRRPISASVADRRPIDASAADRRPISASAADRRPIDPHPLDAILVGVVIALIVGVAATVFSPGLRVRAVAPSLDILIDAVGTFVTLSVAWLGWIRYRQGADPLALFEAAAFLALGIANGLAVVAVTGGLDAQVGMALAAPTQAPLYVFTSVHLLAAALLVIGAVGSLRSLRVRRPRAVVLGPAIAMLVVVAVVLVSADRLPSLGAVGSPVTPGALLPMPAPTPLGAIIQVVVAALFLWGSGLSRRLFRRDGSVGEAYLSVGLVFAAFSQVEGAIYPGTYAGLVTGSDLLRLAFDVTLLLGIQAEAGAAFARLRLANEDLARLRAGEIDRAALEERTRLSRELHDGLAQDLWLAKLKAGRLAALAELAPDARALTDELGQAIDAGLVEAQQAVAALRLSGSRPGSMRDLLARSVDEFADRFGLRVEFECERDLPPVSPRAQAEALRIAQEALNNVRRHADATVVRVRAGVQDGRLLVVVGDNGRGFDPDTVGGTAYGLASMRERAALIGGELRIDSRPRDGTRVSLLVPVAVAPGDAGGSAA